MSRIGDWEAEWVRVLADVGSPSVDYQRFFLTWHGDEAINDVNVGMSRDPENRSGDGYQIPFAMRAGERVEIAVPIGDLPMWAHIVEGLGRGDDSQTTMASFVSPFQGGTSARSGPGGATGRRWP